tara:strand:+ start:2010 stop:2294 length:285 start_codon:yes stop_codon:yes gene_type:complete
MKLKTNKLLLTSLILIVGTFILAMFTEDLGINEKIDSYLVFPYLIAFGLNIAGAIFGVIEKTKKGKKSLTGIIGNSILLILFISLGIFAITKMN